MKEVSYFFAKVWKKLRGDDKEVISNYFRRQGMQMGGVLT